MWTPFGMGKRLSQAAAGSPGGTPEPLRMPEVPPGSVSKKKAVVHPFREDEGRAGAAAGFVTPRNPILSPAGATATLVTPIASPPPAAPANTGVPLADVPEHLRRGNDVGAEALPTADCEDRISIKAFPSAVHGALAVFDKNGDGSVHVRELVQASDLYAASKQTSRRLLVVVAGLVAAIILLVGGVVGLTALVIEESKETRTEPTGALVQKDSHTPVGTSKTVSVQSPFDIVGSTHAVLSQVKRVHLEQDGTLLGYTITGYRATPTTVTLLATSGDAVAVNSSAVSVTRASGSLVYFERRPASGSQGFSTVTLEASTVANRTASAPFV